MHASGTVEFKGWAGSLDLGYSGFGEAVSYLKEMLILFNAEMAAIIDQEGSVVSAVCLHQWLKLINL